MKKNINVRELLNVIPSDLLSNLSLETNVDHYVKVLSGQKLFYLLLFGILENDRLSQRSLEDTFNDKFFKILFSLDQNETIRRSSLSERLTRVNVDFFRQIYETLYANFSQLHTQEEIENVNLIPVDSTLISGFAKRMSQGFSLNSDKIKFIKYTVAFDGSLPCDVKLFTEETHCSENICLPDVVLNCAGKNNNSRDLYLIDRGMQSLKRMVEFKENNIEFVVRSNANRKHVVLESYDIPNPEHGDYLIVKDSKVHLYGRDCDFTERSKSTRQTLIKEPFRLVIIRHKQEESKEIWFISNNFELSANDIASAYKYRWNIEVFFRFIKQELNTKHLLSLNNNGIEVVLYMTLIASILLMIYKKQNKNIGYKTAKRRFLKELRDLIIELIITQCGGDPKLYRLLI